HGLSQKSETAAMHVELAVPAGQETCWLMERMLPSGCLNQATQLPSGVVQMPGFWSWAKGTFSVGTPRSRSQAAIRSTARNGCATGEPLRMDEFTAFQPGQGFDGFAGLLLGEAQIVEVLEIEPKLGTGAKKMSEAESGVARD